jgi:putative ABC transport system permease protein
MIAIQQTARRLMRAPGFTLTIVLTLALGIGASTAIFSAVAPVLLERLPYPNADRIVTLTDRTDDGTPLQATHGTYVEVAARSRAFDALAVTSGGWNPALSGGGDSEYLIGDRVSVDYFRVLGVVPAVGRDFERADHVVGGPQVVIVSDALAQRRFGSARGILDQIILLEGYPHRVIGVMPAGFENVLLPDADVWSALQARDPAPFQSGEWGHSYRLIGRVRAGASIEDAQSDIASIASTPIAEFPRPEHAMLGNGLLVESLRSSVTVGARPVLVAVAGAVLLLLALACVNVTNLLLARGVARRREVALRAVLGAGRPRLVRELLTESLLLAFAGGVLGFGVAVWGVRAIVALAPANLPRIDSVDLDPAAFLFALAVTTLVGFAVGLAPALRGVRPELRHDLQSGARATIGAQLVRRGLVVGEVALALVLLIGAGLLLRSVDRLYSTAPGFDASNVLTLQVVATGYQFEQNGDTYTRRSDPEALQLFQSVLEAVRAVPGVLDAAFTTQLPLTGSNDAYSVRFESATQASPSNTEGAVRYVVTPDYFRAMGIPLLGGRLLDAGDRPGSPEAIVLSESFAKRRFGDRDPMGERLRIGPENAQADRPWDIVVGVVGDVKHSSLGALSPPDAFHVALGQWMWFDYAQSLVVRVDGNPAALAPAIRRAIGSVSSIPAIARVATMEQIVATSEAERRFALTVFAAFAAAAAVLAALGLYGVIAGTVAERTREIGLRSALGATPAQIVALVVRQGMTLAALGIGLGIGGAAMAMRGLDSLLYGVSALDPLTYIGVIAVLAAVAGAACWLPAARAARIDPTIALRAE